MVTNDTCPVCGATISAEDINYSKGFESGGGTWCVPHTCSNCGAEMEACFDLLDNNKFLGVEID